VWIADGDPNLAWLQLVSALESVAAIANVGRQSPIRRLESAWPEVAELLWQVDERVREGLTALLVPTVRIAERTERFVAKYRPPEPALRPDAWAQVNWDEVATLFRIVYHWRSRALHDGTPMPAPMCLPPIVFGTAAQEGGGSAGAYGGVGGTWTHNDVPMMLHTFAYLVRGCVLTWWQHVAGLPTSIAPE
jgi:hypothetical protein